MSGGLPKLVSPGDITDKDLTVGEMRAFMRDTREDMRFFREEVWPLIKEVKDVVMDLRSRVLELERWRQKLETPTPAPKRKARKKC